MGDKELFNLGDYEAIINSYKDNYENINVGKLFYLCKSYYKIKDYESFRTIYKIYKEKNQMQDLLRNQYYWSLYYIISDSKASKTDVINAGNEIIENNSQDNDYLLYTKTIFKIISYYESEKVNSDYASIYLWIKKLNPRNLKDDELIVNVEGRDIKLAGDREKWYVTITKATINLELYKETIEISEEALRTLDNFHNDNDFWFKYKIAKSYAELGEIDKAINLLEKLVIIHEHFCIREKLAELYLNKNNIIEARKYYYESLISRIGSMKNKINSIMGIADILKAEGDLLNSKLNYILASQIRENEGWKPNLILQDKIESLKEVSIDIKNINIEKECKKLWKIKYLENLPKSTGKVVSILPNKRAGFIQTENERIYFSSKSINGNIDSYLNNEVNFYIKEGYDKKKKCKNNEAICIYRV